MTKVIAEAIIKRDTQMKEDNKVVADLQEGETVGIIEMKGKLYKIINTNNDIGIVDKQYINRLGVPTGVFLPAPMKTDTVEAEPKEDIKKTKRELYQEIIQNSSYVQGILKQAEDKKNSKVENNFKRATFYVRHDLLFKFNQLAEVLSKVDKEVTKKSLINDAFIEFLEKREQEGFPFEEYDPIKHKNKI